MIGGEFGLEDIVVKVPEVRFSGGYTCIDCDGALMRVRSERSAKAIASEAGKYSGDIFIKKGEGQFSLKSGINISALGSDYKGHKVEIIVAGESEEAKRAALRIYSGFVSGGMAEPFFGEFGYGTQEEIDLEKRRIEYLINDKERSGWAETRRMNGVEKLRDKLDKNLKGKFTIEDLSCFLNVVCAKYLYSDSSEGMKEAETEVRASMRDIGIERHGAYAAGLMNYLDGLKPIVGDTFRKYALSESFEEKERLRNKIIADMHDAHLFRQDIANVLMMVSFRDPPLTLSEKVQRSKMEWDGIRYDLEEDQKGFHIW